MANVVKITKDNYTAEVKSASIPVVLEFGGEWCQPCKKMLPIMEELALRYAGRMKVGYVDVGLSRDVASEFKVMTLPTILFLKAGTVVRQLVGARSKDELEAVVEEVLD
ncbi:MAG: thioredoxin family protein [Candidatus Riflebacteria bacterium]|nr:thioredoxin family protein [Candidatus Riflebacteria bacterium]